MKVAVVCAKSEEWMASAPPSSVDAIVTDPPYGLGFMGKGWDHGVPGRAFFEAYLRAAKPGAHLVAFGGTRTFHRLACAIEDAGWEMRDCLVWLYGTGFPKSMDVAKAIDKANGATPVDLGASPNWRESKRDREEHGSMEVRGANAGRLTAPATDAARAWTGYGTALKPAYEPIFLARKPLDGTVAGNTILHGVGGLNIDSCRIGTEERPYIVSDRRSGNAVYQDGLQGSKAAGETTKGRWPANVLLDDDAAAALDARVGPAGQKSPLAAGCYSDKGYSGGLNHRDSFSPHDQGGGPSRFFYCAKASRAEREEGLEHLEARLRGDGREALDGPGASNPRLRSSARRNDHPTVKPLALMRWLVRLVTPPGGLVLDPFMGSGTTGIACLEEGRSFLGIDEDAHYLEIARGRILARARRTP